MEALQYYKDIEDRVKREEEKKKEEEEEEEAWRWARHEKFPDAQEF